MTLLKLFPKNLVRKKSFRMRRSRRLSDFGTRVLNSPEHTRSLVPSRTLSSMKPTPSNCYQKRTNQLNRAPNKCYPTKVHWAESWIQATFISLIMMSRRRVTRCRWLMRLSWPIKKSRLCSLSKRRCHWSSSYLMK